MSRKKSWERIVQAVEGNGLFAVKQNLKKIALEIEQEDFDQAPDILYHYTNQGGLEGILKSQTLRLFDCSTGSDPSEFIHAQDMIDFCLKKQSYPCQSRLAAFREYNWQNLKNELTLFIGCLSAERDGIYQWRCYGDNGYGFSIGFDKNAFMPARTQSEECFDSYFGMMRYFDDVNDLNGAQKLIEKYLNPAKIFLSNNQEIKHEKELWKELTVRLLVEAAFIKHSAYHLEKEYRLAAHFLNNSIGEHKKQNCIKFLEKCNSRLYVEKNFNKNSVKSILIGPCHKDKFN